MPTTVTSAIRTQTAWDAMSGAEQAAYDNHYTTLSAWYTAKSGDLVTADQVQIAVCFDDWASGLDDRVDMNASTTDATRYLKITVAAGHRHDGTPQTGFFMKTDTGGNTLCVIESFDSYCVFEYLDLENTRSTGTYAGAFQGSSYNTIESCLFTAGAAAAGVVKSDTSSSSSATWPVYQNCLVYSCGDNGFGQGDDRDRMIMYNCVAANNGADGFHSGDINESIMKNCVAYGNTTDFAGTFDAGSDYNASSDTTASAFTNNVQSVASGAFADAASNDFHLSGTGSALYDVGTDLSGTFTTDVDGDTWVNWSIGFDQVVAAGTYPYQIHKHKKGGMNVLLTR